MLVPPPRETYWTDRVVRSLEPCAHLRGSHVYKTYSRFTSMLSKSEAKCSLPVLWAHPAFILRCPCKATLPDCFSSGTRVASGELIKGAVVVRLKKYHSSSSSTISRWPALRECLLRLTVCLHKQSNRYVWLFMQMWPHRRLAKPADRLKPDVNVHCIQWKAQNLYCVSWWCIQPHARRMISLKLCCTAVIRNNDSISYLSHSAPVSAHLDNVL